MQRIIAYIDGFNLYYGLKSKSWHHFYWLNIQKMAKSFLRQGQFLAQTKYFTSVVNNPPAKHDRQNTYLEALQTLSNVKIYYGHFLEDNITCFHCGHTHVTHHEKMTDVNIAVEMLLDASQNMFDIAFLITADSDLVSPIEAINNLFPTKKVIVIFPPGRFSHQLSITASGFLRIPPSVLAKSQFPNEVIKSDGFILRRPASWK